MKIKDELELLQIKINFLEDELVGLRSYVERDSMDVWRFIRLYGGEGGQVEWISRREILHNLEDVPK